MVIINALSLVLGFTLYLLAVFKGKEAQERSKWRVFYTSSLGAFVKLPAKECHRAAAFALLAALYFCLRLSCK